MSDYSDDGFVYKKSKAKKRNIQESDEEFDEEEIKYAKRRKCIGNFILDEAAVDDDEEEEEEEYYDDNDNIEDLIDNPEEVAEAEDALQYVQYNNRVNHGDLQFENEEEIEEHYRNKYESRENDTFGNGGAMANTINQQSCLPGVRDASIFQVKCFESEEKSSVLKLMHKFSVLRMTNKPVNILSVFSKDNVKGYIYIEAYKEAHVKSAVEDIKTLSYGKPSIKIIPIAEMTDVLKVYKTHKKLERGQWIRINKGLYRGDLGKLMSTDETQGLVTVKLLPRIDYKPIEKNKTNFVRQKFFVKPFPNLLNRKKIAELGLELIKKGKFYTFRKMDFDEQGFLYKDFKMNFIDTHAVKPDLQEIERFNENVNNPNVAKQVINDIESTEQTFFIGELVVVVEGSLKKLCGKIVSIENKNIIVHSTELDQKMCFRSNELRKRFDVGNHVRVLGGKYESETGMVVYSDNKKVVILSDNNINQFEVKPSDLTLSTSNLDRTFSNNKFVIGDLIQIDPKTVGIILQFQKSTMKVLTNLNKVTILDVGGSFVKKNNARTVTLDTNKQEIRVKDIVDVKSGICKDLSGDIRHIWKGVIFLYNNTLSENQGLVATKGQHVMKRGTHVVNKQENSLLNSVPQSPRIHSKVDNSDNKKVFKRPNSTRNDKKFIGEPIRIIKGPLKGKIGIIKDMKSDSAVIELHSELRTVRVAKENFQICDLDGRVANSTYGFQTPSNFKNALSSVSSSKEINYGSQTPMYGSATPFSKGFENGFSTPQIDNSFRHSLARTGPFNPSMATPAYSMNDYNTRTPAYEEQQGNYENDDDDEGIGSWYSKNNNCSPKYSKDVSQDLTRNSFTPVSPEYVSSVGHNEEVDSQNLKSLSKFHLFQNVEVLVSTPDSNIKRGFIVQEQNDNFVNVKLLEEKQILRVKRNCIFRKEPQSCNNVIYLDPSSNNSPSHGICLSVEKEEAVVKLNDGKMLMVPLEHVVPYINDNRLD